MIEMVVDSIRVSLMNYQRVVILKEKATDRYLPIWIGPSEADAIAVKLQSVSVPRPMTHDLMNTIVDALGASINSIIVSDLKNDTFYAKIIINIDGEQMEVDSRPVMLLPWQYESRRPFTLKRECWTRPGYCWTRRRASCYRKQAKRIRLMASR